MRIPLLLDEHLPLAIRSTLHAKDQAIDVLRVGDKGAPRLGASDPDILKYLERSGRTLITRNRATMGAHAEAHLARGGHFNGVFRIRPGVLIGRLVEELYLLWIASEAEEWRDQLLWLPL